jgi:hypothetical protein
MSQQQGSSHQFYQLLIAVNTRHLRALVRLIIEANDSDKDAPLGLKLPSIKDPSETKGDDTPQERAAMRLRGDTQKADDAIDKIDKKRMSNRRNGLRLGKDAELDITTAFDSGTERKFRTNARSALTKLNRELDKDPVNARNVIALFKKINDNPHADVNAKKELQKARMPKAIDMTRDIEIASKPDEDNDQQADLVDLIRTLVTAQRDALDSANVGLNTSAEHETQRKKKIRT